MRELSTRENNLLSRISQISSTEVGLFEVTDTQLVKSTVDATALIRNTFALTGFHDFDQQIVGESGKVKKEVTFHDSGMSHETSMSLYRSNNRPDVKDGDPRLWIYDMKRISPQTVSGDVVAILQDGTRCLVFNLSRFTDEESIIHKLRIFFPQDEYKVSKIAEELLEKLDALAKKGPIPITQKGDGGVGLAIEAALGISPNSKQAPDYKGNIELKSTRGSLSGSALTTLFGSMFDKVNSPIKSYAELLHTYGYSKDGRKRLNCNVTAIAPNPQGLKLSVDFAEGNLNEFFCTDQEEKLVCMWSIETLRAIFADKHNETFWIETKKINTETQKSFLMTKVVHTAGPRLPSFGTFLSDGTILINHTASEKTDGGTRDHGMTFRSKANNIKKLFRHYETYEM